jgi:exocyst complex component 4
MAVDLQMTTKMKTDFDVLRAKFLNLSQTILFCVRLEIRCRVIYYLDLVVREGNYCSDEDIVDPDQYIARLNRELTDIEEVIVEALAPKQARFVFNGLTQLMSTLLIRNVAYIKQLNKNGVQRLVNNVLAIQQNLITFRLLEKKDLDKCITYYELFRKEDKDLLFFIRGSNSFTFDQYKAIINLKYNQNDAPAILKKIGEYFVSRPTI